MPVTAPSRAFFVLVSILVAVLTGWLLHVGASILQPLVIALLLAVLLQPVVKALARFRIPPFVTVVSLTLVIFLGLAQLGLLVRDNIIAFVGSSAERMSSPQLEDRDPVTVLTPEEELGGWDGVVKQIVARMEESGLPEPLVDFAETSIRGLDLTSLATEVIGSGWDFAKGLLLVVIYMLFIFAEQAVFRSKILSVAGERREDAAKVLDNIGRGIQRYLGVKTVTSLATGVLCYSVLVGIDIPYAPLWGFLTFLLNYIPTFGSIAAGFFPFLTALAVEPSGEKAGIVFFTYLAVNVTLGSFIEPKILGRELNLSPLVVVVSVVFWAGLWGVPGMFLAVPLTASLQIILASHENTRPLAVLLSSGPPREERLRLRKEQKARGAAA